MHSPVLLVVIVLLIKIVIIIAATSAVASSSSSPQIVTFKESTLDFDVAEDYYLRNCKSASSVEKLHLSFDLFIPHLPRSASKSSPRLAYCISDEVISSIDDENNRNEYQCIHPESEQYVTLRGVSLFHDDKIYQEEVKRINTSSSSSRSAQAQQQQSSSSTLLFPPPSPSYVSYSRIIERMKLLEKNYPALVQIFELSTDAAGTQKKTIDGKIIYGAKISTSSAPNTNENINIIKNDLKKREIVIVGGMHAREHIAMEVSISLIESLVNLLHLNKNSRAAISYFEWIIIPCLNPDGYEFSRSSTARSHRLWRKNRRRLDERDSRFYGVDLNRNFPFHWGEDVGSSGVYYQETYRGPSAASEMETKAFMNLMKDQNFVTSSSSDNKKQHSLAMVFSVHNYGGSYLIPPGYAQNVYTETFSVTKSLLDDAIQTYHKDLLGKESPNGETSFFIDSIPAWQLYPVSGDLIDWVHEEFSHVPSSTIELRPTSTGGCCGFVLSESKIHSSVFEQTMTMLHVAQNIKKVLEENSTLNSSSSEHLWYRKDQSNKSSIVDMEQVILQNRAQQEDADADGIKDFLDPCLALPKTSSSTTNNNNIQYASSLQHQNSLREQVFRNQVEENCVAPWIVSSSSLETSSALGKTKELFAATNRNNIHQFWYLAVFNKNKDSSPPSSTIVAAWKLSAPNFIDYSFRSALPKTIPIHLLVRSKQFCSSPSSMMKISKTALGFRYIQDCNTPLSSRKTLSNVVDETFGADKVSLTMVENSLQKLDTNLLQHNSNNNNDYCSVQVRFHLHNSHSDSLEEEKLNDFISNIGIEVMDSMNSYVAKTLGCNKQSTSVDVEETEILGIQVRFKKFDDGVRNPVSSAALGRSFWLMIIVCNFVLVFL